MNIQNEYIDSKYKKHIGSLRKAAARAKTNIKDSIEKSKKTFSGLADNVEDCDEKNNLLKKIHKVTLDLQILEKLSEDDIVEFALTTTKKIMSIASNPRLPKELRMMARVASQKAMSSHLARVKRQVDAGSDQSEREEEEMETYDDTGEKLDRMLINNRIVKMRSEIMRAKVHLIHDFTRRIKKLRSYKGQGKKKEKYQRQAERYVKKIIHIKELDADEVSRFALSTKTEDVKKLIADVKIPMKSQALAIITLQKFVATSIEDFRKKFPDWSKTAPSLLKKKKKKRKLNVEDASSSNKKLQKETYVRSESDNDEDFSNEEKESSYSDNDERSEISKSNSEEERFKISSENNEGNGVSHNDSGQIFVINDEEDSENGSGEDEGEDESGEDEGEDEIGEDDDEDESGMEEETEKILESEEDESSNSSEEFQKSSQTDIIKSKAKDTAVKSLKRHLDLPKPQPPSKKLPKTTVTSLKETNTTVKHFDKDIESGKCSPLIKSVKPRVVKEKPKVVDPFFMTTTNEEYLTSQIPTVSDEKDLKWKSKSNDFSQTKFDKTSKLNSWGGGDNDWKRKKFSNRDSHYNQKPFPQHSDKPSFNNGSEPFNIFTNRKERRKALHQPPQEEKVEKLHPSWEAKKKQMSIASFQGKKITFD